MVALGGGAFSYERGTPVITFWQPDGRPRRCKHVGQPPGSDSREREFFIANLLVRIHLIIEMILVDRPCAAMAV